MVFENTGIFVNYDQKEKLKNTIIAYYNQFLEGKLKSNAVGLQQYSRRNLTEKLSHLILKSQIN